MARGRIVDILRYVLTLDTSKFDKNAKKADGQVNALGGGLSRLGAIASKAAIAFGLFKLGEFALDLAKTAARTEVLDTVLDQVAKTTNTSKNELIALRENLKSLGITTQEATGSLIKFLGNDLPIDRINSLADAARNVAVVMGTNTSQAFATLTRAIITQNTVLLKNAGLSIDLEAKFADYAKTQDIAAEAITRSEKRMIVFNAVLERAAPLAGAYEAAMTNVGKRVTSLPRLIEEASNAVGRFFVPAFGAGVDAMSGFLKFITRQFAPGIDTLRSDIAKFGRGLDKFSKTAPRLDELRNQFVTLAEAQKGGADNQQELNDVIAELDKLLPGVSAILARYNTDLEGTATALQNVIDRQQELKQANLLDIVEDQVDAFKSLRGQLEGLQRTNVTGSIRGGTRREANLAQENARLQKLLDDERSIQDEISDLESKGIAFPADIGRLETDLDKVGSEIDISRVAIARYNNQISLLNGQIDTMVDTWARLFPNLEKGTIAYTLLEGASRKAGVGAEFLNKVLARQGKVADDSVARKQLEADEKAAKIRAREQQKLENQRRDIIASSEKKLIEIRKKAAQDSAEAEFKVALSTLLKTKRKELQAAGEFATERGRLEAELELKFLEDSERRAFSQQQQIAEVKRLAAIGGNKTVIESLVALRDKFQLEEIQAAKEHADELAQIRKLGVSLEVEDTETAISRLTAAYETGAISIEEYTAKVRELLLAEKALIESSVDGDLILLSRDDAERLTEITQRLRELEAVYIEIKNQSFSDELVAISNQYQEGAISADQYRKKLREVLQAQLDFLKVQLKTATIPDVIARIQEAIEGVNGALESTGDRVKGIRDVASDVANALNGWADALDSVDSHFADIARSGAQLSGAIATGNIGGAVASGIDFGRELISVVGGFFSRNPQEAENNRVADQIESQRRLSDANDRLISSVDNLARQFENQLISERQGSIDLLREAQSLVDEIRVGSKNQPDFFDDVARLNEILSQFGIDTEVLLRQIIGGDFVSDNINTIGGVIGLLLKELFGDLSASGLFTDPFGDLRTSGGSLITDPEKFAEASFNVMISILKEIAKRGGESGDLGKDLINFWTNFGDLSLEQQRDLLEELIKGVEASGDITDRGLLDLLSALESVEDSIEAQAPDGGDPELSQTRRSVTTITESQANVISGTLNTMLLVMREINSSMKSFLDRASVAVAPSVQTIFQSGAIQVTNNNQFLAQGNVNDVTVVSIEEQLKANARSIGIK